MESKVAHEIRLLFPLPLLLLFLRIRLLLSFLFSLSLLNFKASFLFCLQLLVLDAFFLGQAPRVGSLGATLLEPAGEVSRFDVRLQRGGGKI